MLRVVTILDDRGIIMYYNVLAECCIAKTTLTGSGRSKRGGGSKNQAVGKASEAHSWKTAGMCSDDDDGEESSSACKFIKCKY